MNCGVQAILWLKRRARESNPQLLAQRLISNQLPNHSVTLRRTGYSLPKSVVQQEHLHPRRRVVLGQFSFQVRSRRELRALLRQLELRIDAKRFGKFCFRFCGLVLLAEQYRAAEVPTGWVGGALLRETQIALGFFQFASCAVAARPNQVGFA